MNNGELVIDVADVNHYFGKGRLRSQVLKAVTLQVQAGEVVILTGPSGSGKTTLLTLLGGLRTVTDGRMNVLGTQLCAAPEATRVGLRRRIGYIFQAHNLLSFLTARQNVRLSLEVNGGCSGEEMDKLATDVLAYVGLSDYAQSYPDSLSGGQKQRVAIARALVHRPRLVLADEPTASLDSKSGRAVVELMQNMSRDHGCAIVLVTHDQRILDIADRIIHLEDGRAA